MNLNPNVRFWGISGNQRASYFGRFKPLTNVCFLRKSGHWPQVFFRRSAASSAMATTKAFVGQDGILGMIDASMT